MTLTDQVNGEVLVLVIQEEHLLFEVPLQGRGPDRLLQAAGGIVAAAPDGPGRVRAFEILGAGGVDAVRLAVRLVRSTLED